LRLAAGIRDIAISDTAKAAAGRRLGLTERTSSYKIVGNSWNAVLIDPGWSETWL
jgi:hypothetical protein